MILASRSSPDLRALSSAICCTSAQPLHVLKVTSESASVSARGNLLRIFTEPSSFQEIFHLLVVDPVRCHAIDRIPMLLGDADAIGVAFRDLVYAAGAG